MVTCGIGLSPTIYMFLYIYVILHRSIAFRPLFKLQVKISLMATQNASECNVNHISTYVSPYIFNSQCEEEKHNRVETATLHKSYVGSHAQ